MDVFEQYLSLPGKTDPKLTIFEHSSDVYHVALYLLKANSEEVRNPELIKAGALFHDVGKIEQEHSTTAVDSSASLIQVFIAPVIPSKNEKSLGCQ